MSTTAALIEGHWITARYPDAACQCGAQFEWNYRDKAHALHLLDVVRAEERAAARGKLDKVRAALTGRAPHSQVARDVLAILDGKAGD